MKLALLVALPLLMAACGPGLHEIDREPQDATKDAAAAFTKASQTGDVATIRKMLGPSVVNGGLWFPDPTCEAEFAVPGEVGGGRLDELARCLTTVKLSTSQRKDALLDVAVLSYEPGIEIEARFIDRSTGTWLSWIGYAARHDVADDDTVRRRLEIGRCIAFEYRDAERFELRAHGRIHIAIRAAHAVTFGLGERGDATHECAAHAEYVDAHAAHDNLWAARRHGWGDVSRLHATICAPTEPKVARGRHERNATGARRER